MPPIDQASSQFLRSSPLIRGLMYAQPPRSGKKDATMKGPRLAKRLNSWSMWSHQLSRGSRPQGRDRDRPHPVLAMMHLDTRADIRSTKISASVRSQLRCMRED